MTEPVTSPVQLQTQSGCHGIRMRTARRFWERFRGLMLAPELPFDGGLLLTRCTSVHTMFMRFSIDLVYLDSQGVVTRCVPRVKPWRGSVAGPGPARHVLELAPGAIARFGIAPGDRLRHPLLGAAPQPAGARPVRRRLPPPAAKRGIAVVEFVIAAPILTVLGLSITQYSLLFFAKSQVNHAGFMAARAGSVANAKLDRIQDAYAQALVPMYGGGQDATELATSLARAKADLVGNVQVTMLNPTKESFADFNDPDLQAKLKTQGKKVIPNSNLAFRNKMGATSGQTLQDANLIKLRIVQGVKPLVPIVGSIYTAFLKWTDDGKDGFRTKLILDGRVPVVSHVTLQMQSDAIEPDNPVSIPGPGNNGNPVDPGPPPGPSNPNPPDCPLGGCTTPTPPPGGGGTCPATSSTTLGADTLFPFNQSTLTPDGKSKLDQLVAAIQGKNLKIDTLTVTGYADPLGNNAYNLKLSQDRAQAVSDYLSSKGITADHVNVVGAGATNFVKELSACQPKTGKDLEDCLAPNRRVVVEVKPK